MLRFKFGGSIVLSPARPSRWTGPMQCENRVGDARVPRLLRKSLISAQMPSQCRILAATARNTIPHGCHEAFGWDKRTRSERPEVADVCGFPEVRTESIDVRAPLGDIEQFHYPARRNNAIG